MLRINASSNAAGAAKYFDDGLSRADYFAADEHTLGQWGGKAAAQLGLVGQVDKADFVNLANNRKPDGTKLNPRDSDRRKVAYDFTFSVPKSASIAYAVGGDNRIPQAFEEAVEATMNELETNMRTQSGQGKNKEHRLTGNMVWASFTHQTSRPVDGVPDPHLHRHAFAFNTTWNNSKQRFQAGEFGRIKEDAPYYEAAFESRMAMAMQRLGYEVERKGLSWEIKGIEKSTLDKFSRRTESINKAIAQESKDGQVLSAKQKSNVGALTRAKKVIGQSWNALRELWRSWLSDAERKQLDEAKSPSVHSLAVKKEKEALVAQHALEKAGEHLFERKSVVKETQLKAEALKRSYGQAEPHDIKQQFEQGDYYQRSIRGRDYVTTPKAVREENRMLEHVRQGRGRFEPLNALYEPQTEFLNDEQREAIAHALKDTNSVTIISGGAGTGKTTLMKEVKAGIEAANIPFRGFAPSAAASRGVMRAEGFQSADTMAQLLVNQELQEQVKGGVIWLDEAGLIGNKDMNAVFAIAKQQNSRILLTGDVRQHASVAAGDALRILEKEGEIPVVRINAIQRQRGRESYKAVVQLAAAGQVDASLHKLDRMGNVIQEADGHKRLERLASDYTKAVAKGQSALVISPTHLEGRNVSDVIRQKLKDAGTLKGKERSFLQLKSTHWTEENKSDATHYQNQEYQIEFHQNAPGHRRGDRWQVMQDSGEEGKLSGQKDGKAGKVELGVSSRFTVYRADSVDLMKGDRIRITKGGKTREGIRINNGDFFTVTGFTRSGDIKLHTGRTLNKEFGHFTHGYVTTSHSSQGKTVDQVFVAQSSASQAAASREQFYVSVSRGRIRCRIYTDDKRELESSVKKGGQRMTAREVALLTKKRQNQPRKKERLSPPANNNHKHHEKQQQL